MTYVPDEVCTSSNRKSIPLTILARPLTTRSPNCRSPLRRKATKHKVVNAKQSPLRDLRRLVLQIANHRYGRRDQSTRPSTTRPLNCQSPLRVEGDKAQDRQRLVLQIANHRCGTFNDSSSRLPSTAMGGGIKAQDHRRLALRIANHRCG